MQILLLTLISFAVAVFGTLIGAGGGFLLVPILYFLLPDEPDTITFISLFAVFVNAVSACIAYGRMRRIDLRSGMIFGACTVPTAYVGRMLVRRMDRAGFSPVFGAFLILLGVVMIWRLRTRHRRGRREVKVHWTRRHLVDASGHDFRYAFSMPAGIGAGVLVGFISSFFGIGGGIVHVPIMTQVLNFPVHIATATSIFVLAVSSCAGICTDLFGKGADVPLGLALGAAVGAFTGAQVGAPGCGYSTFSRRR